VKARETHWQSEAVVAVHVRYESEPQLAGNEKAEMRAQAQVHAVYTMGRQVRYWRCLMASSLHLRAMITRRIGGLLLDERARKRHRRRRKKAALRLTWCCVPSPQSNIHTFPDDSFKLQASGQGVMRDSLAAQQTNHEDDTLRNSVGVPEDVPRNVTLSKYSIPD
jgi:hypothetical protein